MLRNRNYLKSASSEAAFLLRVSTCKPRMCGICTLRTPNVRDPHVQYRRIDAIMGINQTEEGYSLTLAFDAQDVCPGVADDRRKIAGKTEAEE